MLLHASLLLLMHLPDFSCLTGDRSAHRRTPTVMILVSGSGWEEPTNTLVGAASLYSVPRFHSISPRTFGAVRRHTVHLMDFQMRIILNIHLLMPTCLVSHDATRHYQVFKHWLP